MTGKITETTTFVQEKLRHCSQWRVHSVYQKTINLCAGEQILAVQSAPSPVSPVSMLTDIQLSSCDAGVIFAGQEVLYDGVQLQFFTPCGTAALTLSFHSCTVYSTLLSAPAADFPVSSLLTRIKQAIHSANAGIFRLMYENNQTEILTGNNALILAAARNRTQQCKEHLARGEYKLAAEQLAQLVGLGIGLTPSGDDFLCGVLAGLIFSNAQNHPFAQCLRAEIVAHSPDTNDISRTFLACAVQRQFSLSVLRLAALPPAEKILQEFLAIGHSSGIDTLCGLAFGVCSSATP